MSLSDTLTAAVTPKMPCGGNYIPHKPHPKQAIGLCSKNPELFLGGAAGGGKSDFLCMSALQFVCVPGYAALLMRRTHDQLVGSDGLIPRLHEWLAPTDAKFHAAHSVFGSNVFSFPSGAHIRLGSAEYDNDRFRFASHAYQCVCFDELTHWRSAKVYEYVGFARRRRPMAAPHLARCPTCGMSVADVPLRTRAGANPGGPGMSWVRSRFQIGFPTRTTKRGFILSKLHDNPSLDAESYAASLMEITDPIERDRMLHGDWEARDGGRLFKREWFVGGAAAA